MFAEGGACAGGEGSASVEPGWAGGSGVHRGRAVEAGSCWVGLDVGPVYGCEVAVPTSPSCPHHLRIWDRQSRARRNYLRIKAANLV